MKEQWDELPAKHKRIIVLAIVGVIFVAIVAWMNSGDEPRDRRARDTQENVIRNVLTNRDTSEVRVERLAAEIENLRDQNRELNRNLERMTRDFSRNQRGTDVGDLETEIREMREEMERIRRDRSGGRPAPAGPDDDYDVVEMGRPQTSAGEAPADQRVAEDPIEALGHESDPMWTGSGPVESPSADAGVIGDVTIRTLQSSTADDEKAEDLERSRRDNEIYLPAGAIVTGTLITGLDAPTGSQARQDPHPALLRIKHEAILPNRFTADVRECFVLLSGHGSLSQERAIMRTERISCVLDNGGVVESRLEAYAVGEDGKAGIRGRLVSKQGQALAKAMIAGGLESFGQAFRRNPVPQLSIGDSDRQIYQQAFSGDAMQSAAIGGFGRAMDRLAQFWIDQAEAIFPVVEVDAGREIEVVLVRGTSIQVSP